MPSELAGRSAVNEIPPFGKLFTLALQHVLTMAGAITVPLLVASSLHLRAKTRLTSSVPTFLLVVS
jgi:xanthine/uracil permease